MCIKRHISITLHHAFIFSDTLENWKEKHNKSPSMTDGLAHLACVNIDLNVHLHIERVSWWMSRVTAPSHPAPFCTPLHTYKHACRKSYILTDTNTRAHTHNRGPLYYLTCTHVSVKSHSYVFSNRSPPHPLISVLTNRPEGWPVVVQEAFTLFTHEDRRWVHCSTWCFLLASSCCACCLGCMVYVCQWSVLGCASQL